ncbi:hypothetical protein P3S68_032015 [Capsicum galapagoense]
MTVEVLNLTLGALPIETFCIHVALRIPDRVEEILSCNPKGVILVSSESGNAVWRGVNECHKHEERKSPSEA